METRAPYSLVGGFVLSLGVAVVLFLIWLVHIGFSKDLLVYDIYFTGSVSGLKEGGSVNYRGIPVGSVQEMVIDPQNVERIRVTVAIESEVPIKEDVFASLELMGITGVSYIQINGGTKDSPILRASENQRHPVIRSRSSRLEEVVNSVPSLLHHLNEVITNVKGFFSPENQEATREVLSNIRKLSASVAQVNAGESLTKLSESFLKTSQKMQTTLDEVRALAKQCTHILKENDKNVNEVLTTGLSSLKSFLNEGSAAFVSIRRVAQQLEKSPRRFFFSDPQQGVKLP